MKKFLACAVLCMALSSFSVSEAQTTVKIGIVDSETIAKQLPEAQESDKKLGEIRKKALDTLEQKQTDLKTRSESYQKGKAMMNADAQKKEEENLSKMYQDLQQYQEMKQQEFTQIREQLYEPIRQSVKTAITEVAKEEKYQLVLDKANPAVLYYEDKADITFRVLDKLKRGAK